MSLETPLSPLFPQHDTSIASHTVYLSLRSNLGDRRGNLSNALQKLRDILEIESVSSVYEAESEEDQPRLLSIACKGKTRLPASDLLAALKEIEEAIGRQRSFRNGPSPITIDILLYDDLQSAQEDLVLPLPQMSRQGFVLVPLAEIAPEVIDPESGKSVQGLRDSLATKDIKKLGPSLRIALDHDIQNGQPTVPVRLGRAGVVGVRKALLIGTAERQQWLDASFDLYADLDTTQAGVHMSRFSDVLEEVLEDLAATTWPKIEVLAEALAQAIVRRQHVSRAEVAIHTSFPLQKWTPVSGRRSQEIYGLLAQAIATPQGSRRMVGVEVEGMVACPCAQDMVHAFARLRLQEEGFEQDAIEKMLNVTPLATHNQRGRATLLIGSDQEIEAGDLIAIVESAMSSENYALLKRPDELYIVNKAHANPRFVEDVVREVLGAVVDKYTELPDETFVWVHQRNEETIHKYDVEAQGWGTLGELRTEILHNQAVAHHTTKEEWLSIAQKPAQPEQKEDES